MFPITAPESPKLRLRTSPSRRAAVVRWEPPLGGPIITTRPNPMMTVIHNNPKAHSGPRMPVMLPVAEWASWLNGEMSYEDIKQFCEPYPADAMQAVAVRQGLKGLQKYRISVLKRAFKKKSQKRSRSIH